MKKIKLDQFDYNVIIFKKKEFNDFIKYMKKKNVYIKKEDCDYGGCTYEFNHLIVIMLLTDKDYILVHELLHAVKAIARNRQIEDEEFECYTLDYLYRKSISYIK